VKLNDAVWGALLFLFSVAVLLHVRSFPNIPGQNVGPALFPGVLAVAMAVCAVLLVANGLKARAQDGERSRWAELDGWTGSRPHFAAFVAVVGVNVFYILLVDKLGFIITGSIYLAVLFLVFRVRAKLVVPLAIVLTLCIHYAFYKLLRVPLPWGLLQGIAW
jgi:putative tricarboxylic transport membrane protein